MASKNIVPPKQIRVVNGICFRAGQEYPESKAIPAATAEHLESFKQNLVINDNKPSITDTKGK
jgi:hypothetical protein